MSNFSININGGNVSFGAASQGSNNTVSGTASVTVENSLSEDVKKLAEQNNKAQEEAAEAIRLVTELTASIESKNKQNSSKLLSVIKENYSWVIPAIRESVKCFANF